MILNRKNKLLLLTFFIGLYVCYALAISNTISVYNEYQSKKNALVSTTNTPELAKQLIQKEKKLDKIIFLNNDKISLSFQNELLKQLDFYCSKYHLKIVDFKEPHTTTQNKTTVSNYIFSLQGSFNGGMALLNNIENTPSLGCIKNIHFEKKKNLKSNIDELFIEVMLEKNGSF